MDDRQPQRRPGDLILDRYMPNATPEEREAAHETLRRLARFVLRVEERKWREQQIRATDGRTVDLEHQP